MPNSTWYTTTSETIDWLRNSAEPWTRYRVAVDIDLHPPGSAEAQRLYNEMVAHPQVQELLTSSANWPGYPLKRHNDARHPLYKLVTLADFGVNPGEALLDQAIAAIVAHQSPQGAFQYPTHIPKAFGGPGEDIWTWILCGTPSLLYALLSFGLESDLRVKRAIEHLVDLGEDNGWRCRAAPELGKFRGPGKREDPCPFATLISLKALSLLPAFHSHPAVHTGINMLLTHWAHRREKKHYLFGIGTDFQKIKYPLVWYDLLHVAEVLSRYPAARNDPRFGEILSTLRTQSGPEGRVTARSMYTAWKSWSFANKKEPSPWLTFFLIRILRRAAE